MTKSDFIRFLREDAPKGDITTQAVLNNPEKICHARITAKQNGIFSGSSVLKTLTEVYPQIQLTQCASDGKSVRAGETVVRLKGPIAKLLISERVTLNLLQRLSGIASVTALFASRIKKSRAILLDTRKTTPGLRTLEKAAVRHGGGHNHRQGLSDAYLIKENHIRAAGGLGLALAKARAHRRQGRGARMLIVEITNLKELKMALPFRPEVILLDNMTPAQMSSALNIRTAFLKANGLANTPPLIQLEISGGITLKNVAAVASLGVDRISVGSLTHSAPALDLSMVIE